MTDNEINAAIAEACGWKGNVLDRDMEGNLWPSYPPLYCNDLNAMHEAEKVFDCPELYEGNLIKTCRGIQYMWHATARQRAEAFLRALGKWKEVQK